MPDRGPAPSRRHHRVGSDHLADQLADHLGPHHNPDRAADHQHSDRVPHDVADHRTPPASSDLGDRHLEAYLKRVYGIERPRRAGDGAHDQVVAYTLPESICAAAMMTPMWLTEAPGFNAATMAAMVPMWLLAMAAIVLQVWMVIFVARIDDDEGAGSCDETDKSLEFIALLVFGCLMWIDVARTLAMAMYLARLPSSAAGASLMPNGKLVYAILYDHQGQSTGFDQTKVVEDESGVSRAYLWFATTLLIVPRAAVAIALWVVGSGFLLHSASDYDLLLNIVALGFVLELDNFMYTGLVPSYCRKTLIDDWPVMSNNRAELGLAYRDWPKKPPPCCPNYCGTGPGEPFERTENEIAPLSVDSDGTKSPWHREHGTAMPPGAAANQNKWGRWQGCSLIIVPGLIVAVAIAAMFAHC